MKDSYYFSHDYNARNDEKIKKLIRVHGWVGYGLFWAIIEELYNNANALQSDCEGIAYELRTDKDCIHSILHDFDLFVHDGDNFGSLSVQRRLDEKDAKSKKASISARKRWDKCERSANAMPSDESRNALKEIKDIKETKDINSDKSERLRLDCLDFYEKNKDKYPHYTPEFFKEFIGYWGEKIVQGKGKGKCLYEMEKTWNLSRRLKTSYDLIWKPKHVTVPVGINSQYLINQ